MALLKVVAGGQTFIVEASNKNTAKAFGQKQLSVVVSDATGADISAHILAGHEIVDLKPVAAEAATEGAAE